MNKEYIKSIVKEIVSESYIDPSTLPISKEQEDEAFDYIKKVLVPISAEYYNKMLTHEPDKQTTSEKVNRGLKKIFSGQKDLYKGKKKYIIIYQSPSTINVVDFRFFIVKDLNGNPMAGFVHPWHKNAIFYKVGSIPPEKPFVSSVYNNLLKENTEPQDLHISKQEEDFAFQFLKNKSDGSYEGAPRLGKRLKKIKHTVSKTPNESDLIVFGGGETAVLFFVEKDEKGQLVYKVGYEDYIPNKFSEKYPIVTEETNKESNILTKEDEERGLQYIRNHVLERVMELFNNGEMRSILMNGKPPIHYGPEEDKFRKSLKKYSHLKNRVRIYKAKWGDQEFLFEIRKLLDGTVVAGYYDLYREPHLFNIDYSIDDPKRPRIGENISQSEKDRLKLVLKEWQTNIRKEYHPNVATNMVDVVQEIIDNLDSNNIIEALNHWKKWEKN